MSSRAASPSSEPQHALPTSALRTAPVIGVVGGIGSGKSLVAAELVRLGGYLIPADQLGHEALQQPAIRARVARRWGPEVLDATGNVVRRRLGARVFADAGERAELEAMVFPYIEQRIAEEIDRGRALSESRFIVLDAAIMLEAGWSRRCDRILFVDSPRALRLARLAGQRGWGEEEVKRREDAQMSLEEKRRQSDAVVTNVAGPDDVARQVRAQLAAWGYLDAEKPA